MARTPACGAPPLDRVFPCRLHASRIHRRSRVPEQEDALRSAVSRQRRNVAHDRRRSEAPGRRDRLLHDPAYVGTESAASPSCALRCAGRRHLPGRRALDRLPSRLLPVRAGPVTALSPPVPRTAAPRLRRRRAAPARSPRIPERSRRIRSLACTRGTGGVGGPRQPTPWLFPTPSLLPRPLTPPR